MKVKVNNPSIAGTKFSQAPNVKESVQKTKPAVWTAEQRGEVIVNDFVRKMSNMKKQAEVRYAFFKDGAKKFAARVKADVASVFPVEYKAIEGRFKGFKKVSPLEQMVKAVKEIKLPKVAMPASLTNIASKVNKKVAVVVAAAASVIGAGATAYAVKENKQ